MSGSSATSDVAGVTRSVQAFGLNEMVALPSSWANAPVGVKACSTHVPINRCFSRTIADSFWTVIVGDARPM